MHKIISCEECTNDNCFIKRYCSPEWISIITSKKTQVWYKKRNYIFREGNRVFGIHFINRGKVKVIITSLGEKQQIVRLANDGHILGHRGLELDNYPVGAVTIEDSLICFVDNDTLTDAFMVNPEFTLNLMMYYSQELRKMEIRTKYLTQMNVQEKVAQALSMIYETFGGQHKAGKIILDVGLSRQEIADIAGTTREQVIRTFTEFKRENIIETENSQILISNYDSLMNIIADFKTEAS